MSKKQDWACPECGYNNFASRTECLNCKCYRSKAFRKNDWTCECCEVNFSSRNACRKCGIDKPNSINVKPQETMKPGDWTCSACNKMNFAVRTVCYGCGKTKPEQSQNIEPVDETCIICFERTIDTVIKSCGHFGIVVSVH